MSRTVHFLLQHAWLYDNIAISHCTAVYWHASQYLCVFLWGVHRGVVHLTALMCTAHHHRKHLQHNHRHNIRTYIHTEFQCCGRPQIIWCSCCGLSGMVMALAYRYRVQGADCSGELLQCDCNSIGLVCVCAIVWGWDTCDNSYSGISFLGTILHATGLIAPYCLWHMQ